MFLDRLMHVQPTPSARRSAAVNYGVALLAVVVAIVVRLLLDQWLGDRLPFVTLFAAVVFAAWYGGRGPAILALGAGTAALAYFVLEPRYTFAVARPEYQAGLLVFAAVAAVAAILMFETGRRAQREAEARQQALERDVSRHRQAEEALRLSEERFRLASSAGRVGIWEWDIVHNAVAWSDSLYEMHGLDRNTFPGTVEGFATLVHPDDRDMVSTALRRSLEEDAAYDLEFRSVRPDGAVFWVHTHAKVIRDDKGRPLRMLGGSVDVTRNKVAEQALRESEARLACLVRLSDALRPLTDPAAILSAATHVLGEHLRVHRVAYADVNGEEAVLHPGYVNGVAPLEGLVRIRDFGEALLDAYRRSDIVAVNDVFSDPMFAEQDRVAYRAADISAFVAVMILRNERWVAAFGVHSAEQRTWTLAEIDLVREVGERTWAAVERARAEQALRQSEEQLARELEDTKRLQSVSSELIREDNAAALYEHILAAAIALMRSDAGTLQVMDADEKVLHMLAWRGIDEQAAEHWRNLSTEESTVCGQALMARQRVIIPDIMQCDSVREGDSREHFLRCGIVAVQSTPLITRDGRAIGMMSTQWRQRHEPEERELRLLDVLARQAADILERVRSREALREADRRKDEFLATLAHELRNPLAPIRHSLELMKYANGDSELLERARAMMERQMQHMVRLVDDLLDVSRITRNKLELRKERVMLAPIIHGAVETCRQQFEHAGHELNVVLPAEPIHIDADGVRLTQVFGNLLTNACKFTEQGGRISLTAEVLGESVVVSVKDNGIGIPRQMLPNLFEPFMQGDRVLERGGGGLGLGLALVKRLVEMHGGRVEACSDGEGCGSEFRVHLPLPVPASAAAVTAEAPASAATLAAGRRILVVDDNRDSADSLALLLTLTGNVTSVAHDGDEAVTQAEAFRPDVVLLDIGLPRMTGYEVCRRIREQPWGSDMVLIALTGWGQDEDRRRSKEAGFDGHLVKPVDERALAQMLAVPATARDA